MKRILWAFLYFLIPGLFLGLGLAGERAVTAVYESAGIPRGCRIVIDAGHGGIDGGAVSCTGAAESGINLQIALKLRDLMHLFGYDTVMIRTEDVSVYTEGETVAAKKLSDLKERVRTVNETENALLIGIHQNTFPDSRYAGTQVFYNRESAAEPARLLQSAFREYLSPGNRRKAAPCHGIYLMERVQCDGLLIECGFLSNPEEEKLLRTDAYQQQLCCVIAATVSQFLSNT